MSVRGAAGGKSALVGLLGALYDLASRAGLSVGLSGENGVEMAEGHGLLGYSRDGEWKERKRV